MDALQQVISGSQVTRFGWANIQPIATVKQLRVVLLPVGHLSKNEVTVLWSHCCLSPWTSS